MSSSGHRQATWALTVSNSSARSLRSGALSVYRQHDLTEHKWSHTCCAARSLARFVFGDDSRENGWSIGALYIKIILLINKCGLCSLKLFGCSFWKPV